MIDDRNDRFKRFLGLRVRLFRKDGYIFIGVLTQIDSEGIFIDDRKLGQTWFSFEAISDIQRYEK